MPDYFVAATHTTAPWYLAVVVIPLAFGAQFLFARRYDWQCESCGHTFTLSPIVAALAPHRMGGRKLVRCPSCGARTWATPVPKS